MVMDLPTILLIVAGAFVVIGITLIIGHFIQQAQLKKVKKEFEQKLLEERAKVQAVKSQLKVEKIQQRQLEARMYVFSKYMGGITTAMKRG